jgi:hypothetical protein
MIGFANLPFFIVTLRLDILFFIAKKSMQKSLGKTSAILFFLWSVNQSNISSTSLYNCIFFNIKLLPISNSYRFILE